MMEIEHEMTDYYIGVLHNFSLMKLSEYLEAMQERIDALEAALRGALNDNYWHEDGCAASNGDPCTCWVDEARALLDKPAEA